MLQQCWNVHENIFGTFILVFRKCILSSKIIRTDTVYKFCMNLLLPVPLNLFVKNSNVNSKLIILKQIFGYDGIILTA